MRLISQKVKKQIDADPFYHRCCLADENCDGRVEMHHNLIYAGQQQDYKFCILPVCANFHHKNEKREDIRDKLDWIMLQRTDLNFLIKTFPRRNWLQLQNYLQQKFKSKI
jgi:hypothetical protein